MNFFNKYNGIPVELTSREVEVVNLIVDELTTSEIADQLCVSIHTIQTHRKNILSKLMVRNSVGVVKYAIKTGLLDYGL